MYIIKELIKRIIARYLFGIRRRGINMFDDIKYLLPHFQAEVIFDIGANLGQSTEKYLRKFANSTAFCFEPVKETFTTLQKRFKKNRRVQCFNIAFWDESGKSKIVIDRHSDMSSLLNHSLNNLSEEKQNLQNVQLETIDQFCTDKKINHINFMKIDTEGADLNVLKGASNMLSQQKIDIVEVEAGMNLQNKRHVAFENIKKLLESNNYFLLAIYEQVGEWQKKEPQLRRTNPVFISEYLIKTHKKN